MKDIPPVILQDSKCIVRNRILIFSVMIFMFLISFTKQTILAEEINDEDQVIYLGENRQSEVIDQPPMEYTHEEHRYLATLIYAEAGGCNYEEKQRVGNVVINRVNDTSSEFRHTIQGVIKQSGQFLSVGGKAWNRGPSEEEMEIAKDLLEGKRVLPSDIVWFSKKCNYGSLYCKTLYHEYSSK